MNRKTFLSIILLTIFIMNSFMIFSNTNLNSNPAIISNSSPELGSSAISVTSPSDLSIPIDDSTNNTISWNLTDSLSIDYMGVYSFVEDAIGADPAGWTITEPANTTLQVISDLENHSKVVEFLDNNDPLDCQMSNSFNATSVGTIEFWIYGATGGGTFEIDLRGGGSNQIVLIWYWNLNFLKNWRGGGAGDQNVISPSNLTTDLWHHFRIDFNRTSGTFNFYYDGMDQGTFLWYSTSANIDEIRLWTSAIGGQQTGLITYVDAIDYSWAPGYYTNRNFNYTTPVSNLVYAIFEDDLQKTNWQTWNTQVLVDYNVSGTSLGVGPHNISLVFNDTIGQWHHDDVGVTVFENQPPQILEILQDPSVPTYQAPINITTHITDNYGVQIVQIETNSTGSFINETMTPLIGSTTNGYWNYTITNYLLNKIIEYRIYATDLYDNTNISVTKSFGYFDFLEPNILSVIQEPMVPDYQDTVNITVHITDDTEIQEVLIETNGTAPPYDYAGAYSFTDDADGANPAGWILVEPANTTIQVINNLDEHYKVLELQDDSIGLAAEIHNTFSPKSSGTIEFWIYGSSGNTELDLMGSGSRRIILIWYWSDNYLRNWRGGGAGDQIPISQPGLTNNTWHHFRIDFNRGTGTFSLYQNSFLLGTYNWYSTGADIDEVFFFTSSINGILVGQVSYLDAIDYSWASGYYTSRNMEIVNGTAPPYDYLGLFSFTEDNAGADPAGWDVYEGSNTHVEVVDYLDTHHKVVELWDNINLDVTGLTSLDYTVAPDQGSGTIEFWIYGMEGTANRDIFYVNFWDGSILAFTLCANWDTGQDLFQNYYDAAQIVPNGAFSSDTWHHIRIQWDCSSAKFYAWWNGQYRGQFNFRNLGGTAVALEEISFVTSGVYSAGNFRAYIDAVDFSWDSGYYINRNMDYDVSVLDTNTLTNKSMIQNGGTLQDGTWTYTFPNCPLNKYIYYRIYAIDSIGNTNSTIQYNFGVFDLVSPTINSITQNPSLLTKVEPVNVTTFISDDLDIFTVLIESNHTGSLLNYSMSLISGSTQSGVRSYVIDNYPLNKTIQYRIYAIDVAGHTSVSGYQNFGIFPIIDCYIPADLDIDVELGRNKQAEITFTFQNTGNTIWLNLNFTIILPSEWSSDVLTHSITQLNPGQEINLTFKVTPPSTFKEEDVQIIPIIYEATIYETGDYIVDSITVAITGVKIRGFFIWIIVIVGSIAAAATTSYIFIQKRRAPASPSKLKDKSKKPASLKVDLSKDLPGTYAVLSTEILHKVNNLSHITDHEKQLLIEFLTQLDEEEIEEVIKDLEDFQFD